MPTEAWRGSARNELARQVFELCQNRIEDFRRSRPPMPLVVLHAEGAADGDAEASVGELVSLVHEAQAQRGMLVKKLTSDVPPHAGPPATGPEAGPDAGSDEAAYPLAVGMLRSLSQPTWANQTRSQYQGFSFPRSQLMLAIEQATDAVRPPETGGPQAPGAGNGQLTQEEFEQRLVSELQAMRWQPRRSAAGAASAASAGDASAVESGTAAVSRFWSALGDFGQQLRDTAGPLGGVLLVALGASLSQVGGLQAGAFTAAVVVVALIGILAFRLAPSRLWLRPSGRWLATTTFLASYATPRGFARWSRWRYRNSWEVIEARACAVGQRIVEARRGNPDLRARENARQFHRELLAIALLEDLRDNFRPHTLDLRGRKRTVPPVVSLPHATRANGGQLLVRTLSDVRSRRSEQDPLLVVAAIPAAEAEPFFRPGGPPAAGLGPDRADEAGSSPEALYDRWRTDLSVGQSPRLSTLAWVLRIPLDPGQLTERRSQSVSVTSVRPTWARKVWSWPALIAVLICAVVSGALVDQRMADRYCHGRLLGSNVDTTWERGPVGGRECVGVATGDVRFADVGKGDRPTLGGLGSGVGLAAIEGAIRAQNAAVGGAPHVTIVYAGPLSATATGISKPLKGLEELTGVYLEQRTVNAKSAVKLKVLVANGGDDMRFEHAMVSRIIGLARRDPSVVGVVGLGRDTTHSADSARRLQKAGLPIVDTTNSGSYLATDYANYFGLAATDREQGQVLGRIGKQVAGPKGSRTAVVLSRRTEKTDHDRYTQEQHDYGRQMLVDAGFRLLDDQEYSLTGASGDADLTGPVTAICAAGPQPDAMYFAGRVEDLGGLMDLLHTTSGCANRPITIFTGDDLSKADFLRGEAGVPRKVTLYYVSLAPMDKGGGMADLQANARQAFAELRPDGKAPAVRTPAYDDPLFSSGQVALAHDATAALYRAASQPGISTAAETWANLRGVTVDNMATGTITFEGTVPYRPQNVHGINVIRVRYPEDPTSRYQVKIVCGQAAGDPRGLAAVRCTP